MWSDLRSVLDEVSRAIAAIVGLPLLVGAAEAGKEANKRLKRAVTRKYTRQF